jgi:hypothetical protein
MRYSSMKSVKARKIGTTHTIPADVDSESPSLR